MSAESKQMVEQATAMITAARAMCDHANHKHDYDSDGPGYTCNDCGEFGYGNCPEDWPCELRKTK